MKQKLLRFHALILSGLIVVAAIMSAAPVYAAGASISLEASKSIVNAGGTVVVAIYMNGGGTPINAVESDLSYPASQLQYVGISYSGSAFSINAPNNGGGNGSVTIGDGTTSPVAGSGLIATVTFKALVGSGSGAINVAGSSSLVSANDNSAVPFAAVGTAVKFGAVATPAPVAGTPSSAAPAPAPVAPAPPKDTTPPVISDLKIASRTPYSAVISWTTNEPADSEVDYGLDANYGLSVSAAALTTTHSVNLNSTFLTPATLFHFRAKSTDASGNVQTGADQTLGLPGVPVVVVVRGADGKPQAGAAVSLDGQSTTTNASGQATLTTGLGNKQVTTSFNGVTLTQPITVGRSTKPLPPIQLDLSKKPLNRWLLVSIGLFVIILLLLGLDAVLFASSFLTRLIHWRQPRILSAVVAAGPTPVHTDADHAVKDAANKAKPANKLAKLEPKLVTPPIAVTEPSQPTTALAATAPNPDLAPTEQPAYPTFDSQPRAGLPASQQVSPTFADDSEPLPAAVAALDINAPVIAPVSAASSTSLPTAPLMAEVKAIKPLTSPRQIVVNQPQAFAADHPGAHTDSIERINLPGLTDESLNSSSSKTKAASVAKRLKPRAKPALKPSAKSVATSKTAKK